MAGKTKILKDGELLFRLGDSADAMYIIRRGALKVFFPKGRSEEVTIALLREGAIVGEMAFFDEKPRSASVKASGPAEVTVIDRSDFEKLLSQVPKWMVTMMQSLVARLRQTNERLQALEAAQANGSHSKGESGAESSSILPNQRHPFQHALRGVQILLLSLAKDGEKDGREIIVKREYPTALWQDFSGEDEKIFEKVLFCLEKCRFISLKQDAHRSPIVFFVNRGSLVNFAGFFARVSKALKPLQPFFSPAAISLLETLLVRISSSGYESLNVGFKTLVAEAQAHGEPIAEWAKALQELQPLNEIRITKTGDDISLKVSLKDFKQCVNYIKLMQVFYESGLA